MLNPPMIESRMIDQYIALRQQSTDTIEFA